MTMTTTTADMPPARPPATRLAAPLATIAALAALAVASAPVRAADPEASALAAFARASEWVRTLDVPAPDDDASRVPLGDVAGVQVTLRVRGRIVGRALRVADAAVDGDTIDPDRAVRLLRDTVATAIGRALGDETIAALRRDAQAGGDVPDAAMNRLVGRRLLLEVEVLAPFDPLPGATFADAGATVDPGVHGIALRAGDDLAVRTASRLVATGLGDRPERAFRSLALELGFEAGFGDRDLGQLRRTADVRAFRFVTAHVVEPAPGAEPVLLARGDRVLPLVPADDPVALRQSALDLGRGVVRHFGAALWTADDEPLGITGDYRPGADRVDPLVAPPRDQALAALALAAWGNATAGARATSSEIAAEMAALLLDQLAETAAIEDPADPARDPALAALVAGAAMRLPAGMLLREGVPTAPAPASAPASARAEPVPTPGRLLVDAATAVLDRLADEARGVGEAADDDANLPALDALDPLTLALVAWALAERAELLVPGGTDAGSAGASDAIAAAAILDRARLALPEPERLSLLPWSGLAVVALGPYEGRGGGVAAGPLPARTAELVQVIEVLRRLRVGGPELAGPPELAGGIAFSLRPSPRPDDQSLRVLPFLAVAADDPVLGPVVGDAAVPEMLRFARQLSIRIGARWWLPRPSRAIGGVRAALWDPRQPRAGSAMALFGAAEALERLPAAEEEDDAGAGGR